MEAYGTSESTGRKVENRLMIAGGITANEWGQASAPVYPPVPPGAVLMFEPGPEPMTPQQTKLPELERRNQPDTPATLSWQVLLSGTDCGARTANPLMITRGHVNRLLTADKDKD